MRVFSRILIAVITTGCCAAQNQASAEYPPSHWEVAATASDVDISPDDRRLALIVETPVSAGKARRDIAESVEIWDYQNSEKIASAPLATQPWTLAPHGGVRFTADGSLLAAADLTKLHVLDGLTLKEVRVIQPPFSGEFRITRLETAPTGHVAIVAAADQSFHGVLYVFELDSGRMLFRWNPPRPISSIAWKEDGTQLAVATPFPCTIFRDTVQVFGTNPWLFERTLRARNPASVAFSADRLFVVENGFCKGSWLNRHLGLESFGVRDWHSQKTILLPHRDVHDVVAYANGRLLADTGELKLVHDWLDMTAWAHATDVQFTVWKGAIPSVEFVSPAMPASSKHLIFRPGPALRLSRSGKVVVLNSEHPQVFQLP